MKTEIAFILFMCVALSFSLTVEAEHNSYFGKEKDVCNGDKCKRFESESEQRSYQTEFAQSQMDTMTRTGTPTTSQTSEDVLNVFITFTNAVGKTKFHEKFKLTVSSLIRHASIPLKIFIIGEDKSQKIANNILGPILENTPIKHEVDELDVDHLAKQLHEIIKPMQDKFSSKPGAYYNHALFFLSIAIHRVMPADMHRVIMLDADLKFMEDIKHLAEFFDKFEEDTIMGIGYDLQPVYRHTFWKYRQMNKGTRVGAPKPNGLQGFNSGVLLLNLDKMRQSKLYNSLITAEGVTNLTEEFNFKGHLGDQDFFTLISMKYEKLFYVIPCNWNRQLCQWWKKHGGYNDVWDDYYNCDGDVKIYHGNCDTPIPAT